MKLTKTEFDALAAKGLVPQDHDLSDFAVACYDDNSVSEIIDFDTAEPDATDMKQWGIDADEWREAQREALEVAMFMFEQDE